MQVKRVVKILHKDHFAALPAFEKQHQVVAIFKVITFSGHDMWLTQMNRSIREINAATVSNKITRALEIIRVKKLIPNVVLRNTYLSSHYL